MIEEPCTGIPPRTDRCAQLDVIANSLPVIVAPRCSRGIIGWSVMRSRVRFSEGLRPKADAASTIRSGRGIYARVPIRRLRARPSAGAALGAHVLQRVVRAADPREVAPEAKAPSFESVPGLHGDVGVPEVQSLAELPRQSLFPHARNQD